MNGFDQSVLRVKFPGVVAITFEPGAKSYVFNVGIFRHKCCNVIVWGNMTRCNTSLVLISSYKHICPSLNIRHISCYPKCQLNEDLFINESLLKANIFSASFNTSSFSIQYLNGISNTLHL